MKSLLFALVLLLAACEREVTRPDCLPPAIVSARTFADDTANVVDVSSEEELRMGLRMGYTSFRLVNSIGVTAPFVMDSLARHNFFTMTGPGGYGAHIHREFGGPEPMFSFGPGKPWQLRLKGLAFEPGRSRFPDAGPSLYVHKMFLSLFEDVMFENHPGRPFVIEGGSGITFRDVALQSNGRSALVTHSGDIRIYGGSVEDHRWAFAPYGDTVATGLDVYAEPTLDVPIVLQDVHQELSIINVVGFERAYVRPGYQLASAIYLKDVKCVHGP